MRNVNVPCSMMGMLGFSLSSRRQLGICLMMWLLSASLRQATAGLDRRCYKNNPGRPVYLCGNKLTAILSLVCGRTFNKRAPETSDHSNPPLPVIDDNAIARKIGQDESIFLTSKTAHSFLQKRVEYIQGAACECCYNRCSVTELHEYCSGPALKQQVRKKSARSSVDDADSLLGIMVDRMQRQKKMEPLRHDNTKPAQETTDWWPETEDVGVPMDVNQGPSQRSVNLVNTGKTPSQEAENSKEAIKEQSAATELNANDL